MRPFYPEAAVIYGMFFSGKDSLREASVAIAITAAAAAEYQVVGNSINIDEWFGKVVSRCSKVNKLVRNGQVNIHIAFVCELFTDLRFDWTQFRPQLIYLH